MNTVAIIGAGVCGLFSALQLLRKGYQVDLYDIGANSINLREDEDWNLGEIKGELFHYDLNRYNVLKSTNFRRDWFTATSLAGFTNVWGATWEEHIRVNDSVLDAHYQNVDSQVLGINDVFQQQLGCSCFSNNMKSLNSRVNDRPMEKWQIPRLAIKKESCFFVGSCVNSCPHGAIWSAKSFFEQCTQFDDFHYFPNHFLDTFRKSGNHIELNFKNEDKVRQCFYSQVILATGPVALSMLILRSKVCNQITLRDTRILKHAFIRIKSFPKHEGKFSLAGLSATFYDRNFIALSHTQFYSHVDAFIKRITQKSQLFKLVIVQKLFNRLVPNLVFALSYLDQDQSDRLSFTLNEDVVEVTKQSNPRQLLAIISLYKKFFLRSFQSGLIPIPYFDAGQPGNSYHVGNPVEREEILDCEYRVKGIPEIMVVGSFALPYLPPGAITRSALAQTSLAISNFTN